MKYSYAQAAEGPWIDMYDSSAKALEAGRARIYDLEGDRPPIFVARISFISLAGLLTPAVMAETLIAEAKEAAVTGRDNSGDDFVNFLDEHLPADAMDELAANLHGTLDWWQNEFDVPMVPHVEEVRSYAEEAALDKF